MKTQFEFSIYCICRIVDFIMIKDNPNPMVEITIDNKKYFNKKRRCKECDSIFVRRLE